MNSPIPYGALLLAAVAIITMLPKANSETLRGEWGPASTFVVLAAMSLFLLALAISGTLED